MGRAAHLCVLLGPFRLTARRRPPENARVRRLLAPAAILAVTIGLGLSAPVAGGAPPPLAQKLGRALRVPHVPQARTAAVAVDLAGGAMVYSLHPSLALAPASNEKLAISYAALATLGPAFRIETQVLGVGGLSGSTWTGSVTLRGAGDPTLSTRDLEALAT